MHFKAEGEGQLQRFVGDCESALKPIILFFLSYYIPLFLHLLSQQKSGGYAQLPHWRRAQQGANFILFCCTLSFSMASFYCQNNYMNI